MLISLHIENIAVIKQLDVDFSEGFHALTGQTGAGKSILIDSIRLLLGDRADRDLIRTGEQKGTVSALFTADSQELQKELLALEALTDENEVFLSRTVSADGRSSSKINGRSVPLTMLREVGRLLISIHGQHDSIALLDPEYHLGLLDAYGETECLLRAYEDIYREVTLCKKELQALLKDEKDSERMTEVLRYQIKEIDAAKLKKGEEIFLKEQRALLSKAEKISKNTRIIYRALYQNEKGNAASSLISLAKDAVTALGDSFPDCSSVLDRLNACQAELEDIAEQAAALCDFGGDPTELLTRTEDRLALVDRLSLKYGNGTEEILAYRAKCEKDLAVIESRDALIFECKKKLSLLAAKARSAASALNEARKEAAQKLETAVGRELAFLDLEKVRFSVKITESKGGTGNLKLRSDGQDIVEFFIATNSGEPLKPLSKIASGGELSRIMLALKCVFAEKDRIPSLVFDEIDTGVSGKTSEKIGIKLKEIAKCTQVFCVTHSAQIAALAQRQYLISKEDKDGRTETALTELDFDGRVAELSRIIGGIQITKNVTDTAIEMLCQGSRNKGD